MEGPSDTPYHSEQLAGRPMGVRTDGERNPFGVGSVAKMGLAMQVLWGIGGMLVLLGLAVLLSENRRKINIRTVLCALALQVGFGFVVLYSAVGARVLDSVSSGVQEVINSSNAGIEFLFGSALPEDGVIFAFQVLPVIVFFAALTAVLYHFGILQVVVRVIGGGLAKVLGTREAESVNAAANIFVGQAEAPLIIRPYLHNISRSGLFAVMVGGLSTVAGSVLVGYSLLGAPLEYLIAASFMAAPGALLMAKIIIPETDKTDQAVAEDEPVAEESSTTDRAAEHAATATGDGSAHSDTPDTRVEAATSTDSDLLGPTGEVASAEAQDDAAGGDSRHRNVIDAIAAGTVEGLRLALTVGAMLLAFISLIALLNLIIGTVGGWFGFGDLTFQQILGWVFAPLMSAIGVPWSEAVQAGSFVGQKVVVNEFVAFADFAPQIDSFDPRTAAIITFALTGFANLGSLGILLGGLGSLVPHRRSEIAELAIRAVLAGTLANLMSAAIAGIMVT